MNLNPIPIVLTTSIGLIAFLTGGLTSALWAIAICMLLIAVITMFVSKP